MSVPPPHAEEQAIRSELGIPPDAREVLVFGETSHWDPNWLYTTEEYYQRCIPGILDAVIEALEREPRRVFALESVFFLQHYWERNPSRQPALRRLLGERRLRLTGSGITTPDTVLPDTEALLRDYANGQNWLDREGLPVEPRLAYLPDDFGHSPALPTMLVALGYDMAVVTRIDGAYFVACDYRPKSAFPLPGSSADLLTNDLKTADFRWRGPDGSEVLCHWNPFTYFQGDLLAHVGVVRWMDHIYGFPWRTEAHVARRIRGFVRELRPLARTPYLFCPIGGDFNGPIEGLVDLLDRENRVRYPETGVWVLNAGVDDYLRLVRCHADALPVVDLDPNPYWMGFYASRPEAKRRSNRIVRKLVMAEKLAVLPHVEPDPPAGPGGLAHPEFVERLRAAWDLVVLSNHHDFITGTSPDRVWREEQLPWLQQAETLADEGLAHIRSVRVPPTARPRRAAPSWRRTGGVVAIETDDYRLEISEEHGGAITSFRLAGSSRELLSGPSNELVSYRDSGGLWRLGHEFRGGEFVEVERGSSRPAAIAVEPFGDLLEVRIESELEGLPFVRRLWCRNGSPVLRLRLVGAARAKRTVTCRFSTVFAASQLTMDVTGGIVDRPVEKLYRPTFWPARSFVHLQSAPEGPGLAAFLGGPATASSDGAGSLEWIALRNAPREMAFGVLPILAHPASGTDPHQGDLEYAVWFTPGGDARHNRLPHHVRSALRAALFDPHEADLDELANSVVLVDRADVKVTALKPAFDGRGVIVRLSSFAPGPVEVRLSCPSRPIQRATACDARERDGTPLPVRDGVVVVPLPRALGSVRVLL
jgi:hypothetical protein